MTDLTPERLDEIERCAGLVDGGTPTGRELILSLVTASRAALRAATAMRAIQEEVAKLRKMLPRCRFCSKLIEPDHVRVGDAQWDAHLSCLREAAQNGGKLP